MMKMYNKNRKISNEWIEQFEVPGRFGIILVCLILNKTVAIAKHSNLKHCYETTQIV